MTHENNKSIITLFSLSKTQASRGAERKLSLLAPGSG